MSFDEATGEPWRCKFCVFYHFCRIGRCASYIPLEFFTRDDWAQVEKLYRKSGSHESAGGPYFGLEIEGG